MVVSAQEKRFALYPMLVDCGDLSGRRCNNLLQQANGGVRANDSLIYLPPLAIQVDARFGRTPVKAFEVVDRWLIERIGSLVGIVTGDAAERPVADCASPAAILRRICAIESAIRRDQASLYAVFRGQRGGVERPLWRGCVL